MNYLTGEFTNELHEWKTVRGGILADETGLGKTVMAISLLADDNFTGTSLVVVPKNVINHWIAQFNTMCPNSVKVYDFHEKNKKRGVDLNEFDVVLTTYGVLGN